MDNLFDAVDFLYSLKHIDSEVREKLDFLEQLRTLATSITVSTEKEAIQTSSSKDKIGGLVAKIVDLENELEDYAQALAYRREVAKDIIFEIKSECYQNMLYDYFICNFPLSRIADNNEILQSTARYQLKQATKEFEKIFDSKKQQRIQHIACGGN